MWDGGGGPSSSRWAIWGPVGHLKALGGELRVGAIHRAFSFSRLYLVFGMDEVDVVIHPCTIGNEEDVRGIRSSERLEL